MPARIFSRLSRRLGLIRRSEAGMVLPTVLFATVAALGVSTAAVVATIDTQRGTVRDNNSKEASAAADAGADVALMRLNRYADLLSTSSPCLAVSGGNLVLSGTSADGWCPAISSSVGGASYSYRVSPQVANGTLTVVSTGSSGGVTQRSAVSLKATTVGSLLSGMGVIAQEDINLSNSAEIRTGVGTNGNLNLSGSATICGNIRYGVGKKVTYVNSAQQCNGYSTSEGNQTLPPVSSFMPSDISTNNSDYRLAKCTSSNNPVGCQLDPFSSNNKNNWPWIPSSRTIELTNSSTLTLGGGDYFICKLVIANSSTLIMAAGAHVRIFFDTPEKCGQSSGTAQIDIGNSSNIEATGYGSAPGQFDVPGLYVQGSASRETRVNFGNSSGSNQFVLYAPNSNVDINNSATFKGTIVGKKVSLANSAKVEQDAGFEPPAIGGATLYARQAYVQCSGTVVSPPNAGC
jgi:hypothetical protein